MPSKHTPNYNLCQWERSDKVLMEDFNADNAKIDAALKSEADARTSAVASLTSQVAGKGNCRIWSTTYTGTGTYGADQPNRISLPAKPMVVFIADPSSGACYTLGYGTQKGWCYSGGSSKYCDVSWSTNSVSLTGIQHSGMNMNESSKTYLVIALIAVS